MWELDCKEIWVPKNWYFETVVVEKIFESPLDSKKIQPVHPKGDQSWVFIGRTDVEVETPILWPPHAKSWLIGNDSDVGRDCNFIGIKGNSYITPKSESILPSIFSSIRVFSNESLLHITWPEYWSFSFNISPSSAYSGVTSFRMDWLDLLAVQGTLNSLLQHHSTKALILRRSAFFTVQLSHPYITTGKTIALTRQKQSKQRQLFMLLKHQGRGIQATLWHDFFHH